MATILLPWLLLSLSCGRTDKPVRIVTPGETESSVWYTVSGLPPGPVLDDHLATGRSLIFVETPGHDAAPRLFEALLPLFHRHGGTRLSFWFAPVPEEGEDPSDPETARNLLLRRDARWGYEELQDVLVGLGRFNDGLGEDEQPLSLFDAGETVPEGAGPLLAAVRSDEAAELAARWREEGRETVVIRLYGILRTAEGAVIPAGGDLEPLLIAGTPEERSRYLPLAGSPLEGRSLPGEGETWEAAADALLVTGPVTHMKALTPIGGFPDREETGPARLTFPEYREGGPDWWVRAGMRRKLRRQAGQWQKEIREAVGSAGN